MRFNLWPLNLRRSRVLHFQEMAPDLDMAASSLCSRNALEMSSSILAIPIDSSHSHPRNVAVNGNSRQGKTPPPDVDGSPWDGWVLESGKWGEAG